MKDVHVDRLAGRIVARMPELQRPLQSYAIIVLGTARRLAAAHVDSGNYMRSLFLVPDLHRSGVLDRVVGSADPAAWPIEAGFDTPKGKRVAGQWILHRAAGLSLGGGN